MSQDAIVQRLLADYWSARQEAIELERLIAKLEDDLLRQMQARGATSIPSEQFDVRLEVRDTYDKSAFAPLKELLTSEDLRRCWSPAYTEEVVRPESWDTVKVKAVARRYGTEAMTVVENARVPGRPRVVVTPKSVGG